jgi:NAD(P)-dependent dehydrogenase (short-subunit alcohol dehydrogenase family)
MTMLKILVTGSNQGIGYATVRQIIAESSEGVQVYIGARSFTKAKEAIEKIKVDISDKSPAQIELIPIEIDITKNETIEKAVKQIPSLDILVNNAGIYGEYFCTIEDF